MKHGVKAVKLNRNPQDRLRLLRSLATQLFLHSRLQTTLPRAKALAPYAERCVNLALRGTEAARQKLMERVWPVTGVVGKILEQNRLAKWTGRQGGWVRVMKAGRREGDCAPMAVIELVDESHKHQPIAQDQTETE